MRYMVHVNMAEDAGPPTPALAAAMDDWLRQGFADGVLVDAGGLAPSSQSLHVVVRGGQVTTTDGPFSEAKEVVGGYGLVEVRDEAEAHELGRQMARLHAELWPGWEGSVHVRRVFGPDDGPPTE